MARVFHRSRRVPALSVTPWKIRNYPKWVVTHRLGIAALNQYTEVNDCTEKLTLYLNSQQEVALFAVPVILSPHSACRFRKPRDYEKPFRCRVVSEVCKLLLSNPFPRNSSAAVQHRARILWKSSKVHERQLQLRPGWAGCNNYITVHKAVILAIIHIHFSSLDGEILKYYVHCGGFLIYSS